MVLSSLTNNVIVTLLYNDGKTRNITFEEVSSSDLSSVKSKIMAINTNANNEYANFYRTFISDDGEAVVKIESCKIVSIEEDVIYSG